MRLLIYSAHSYEKSALTEAASSRHKCTFTQERLSIDSVQLADGYDAISIFTSDDASSNVLKALHRIGIRYVALRCSGYDQVDLQTAEALGIRVSNAPNYSPFSIAEHAVAMLLAFSRKIIKGHDMLMKHDLRIDSLKGFTLHGKTVGIIGVGKTGKALAGILRGFGSTVIAHDLRIDHDLVSAGIEFTSLEDLLRRSDIVSLHCPLNNLTRHLLSYTQFNWMKKGAILINTSRGALINTEDLLRSLRNGRLGGVCLDVYEFEKGLFFEDHRRTGIGDATFNELISLENVLLTCHQAFLTNESIEDIADETIRSLDCWQKGISSETELFSIKSPETGSIKKATS